MSSRPHTLLAFVVLLPLAGARDGRADAPLPPPATHEARSRDGSHVAVTVPKTLTTTVEAVRKDGTRERRWAMYGWFRALYVANDGEHVVAGYDGLNLLPLDVAGDQILLRFFRRGEQIATVSLLDLVPDRASLKRTASHWLWREAEGFDADGRFAVVLADGARRVFDPSTGRPVLPTR